MDPQHQETPYTLKIKKQELTVLSYFQDLNDYSSYQRAGRTPRDLLQMWKDCFDCLYEEGATDPKFMMWGNHPFVGGRCGVRLDANLIEGLIVRRRKPTTVDPVTVGRIEQQ